MNFPQTHTTVPRAPTLQPGTELHGDFGVYYLGNFLGNGYFGQVYECHDEWGNELVAKTLSPHIPIQDWDRERTTLLAMRHPNITYIYDAFITNLGIPFLILERCVGSIDRVPLPPPGSFTRFARDILRALAFVHRQGYVHKDIHPGNIFVGYTRDSLDDRKAPVLCFKIGDFGISRPGPDIRQPGTVLANWMLPPEALDPSFGQVDHRTDIYHAALVFMGLLRGEMHPFTPDEIMRGVPRQMAETLPPPYGAAIGQALRRHTGARYLSALEFWRAIWASSPERM